MHLRCTHFKVLDALEKNEIQKDCNYAKNPQKSNAFLFECIRLCEFVAMSGQHRAQLHEMKKPQIERK